MAKGFWARWRLPLLVGVVVLAGGGTALATMLPDSHGQGAASAPATTDPGTTYAPKPSPSRSASPSPTPPPTTEPPSPSPSEPVGPKVDCTQVKCVAMTFDDGPGEYTNQLLDILKDKGVKATFFPSGNMIEGHPDVLKREAAEGHVIANHSYRHSSMAKDGPEAACNYLKQTADLVAGLGIPSPTLMRPPYGDIRQSNIDACPGYSYILWNVDTLDWQNKDADKIMANVQAQTGPGSIILQHDTQPVNLTAVPMVIDWLRAQGYTLVTVPELFNGDVPLDRTVCRGLHPDATGDPYGC